MEQSSISTNVNIDFPKKVQSTTEKRVYKPRIPTKRPAPEPKSNDFDPKRETPVRIGSLLWLEQVGQCIFIEYKDDIIIVDAGMEFAAEDTLWVDYLIPDISYLKKNQHKIKGILLSHGHLDHIGALRHILPALDFPMLYTTPLTLGIVKKTFEDPKQIAKIKAKIVNADTDVIKLWCFTIEYVHVNHNIPETMAMSIHTPKWVIFNSSDFKIDHTPAIDKPADLAKIARIGMEWVKLYIGDSLGASKPGFAISEKKVWEQIDHVVWSTKSRLVVATFASNVGRIIQVIQSAIKYNKIVFLSGRSMVNNVEICQQLGYIQNPKWFIRKLVNPNEVDTLPDDRVLLLTTWAQGEEFSALARMARNEHPKFELKEWDTVMVSASTIPGNESQFAKMINGLVVKKLKLITSDAMDVHASGHGGMEDHKIILGLVKPEFFLPYYMPAGERYAHRALWLDLGIPDERILMPEKNGSIIEMYDDRVIISNNVMKLDTVMIDGLGIWHLSGEYVIKARKIMAQDGVLSLIFKIDTKSREIVGNVQIESRWFVYSSEVQKVHTDIVEFAKKRYYYHLKQTSDIKIILKMIKDELEVFLKKNIGRTPMVMPMFVYINRDAVKDESKLDAMSADDAIVGMTIDEQGSD
jgi:ribonuclease J